MNVFFIGDEMTRIGDIKVIYMDDGRKRSVSGRGEDMGAYVKVQLNPSRRRTRFNIVLIPWTNIVKATVMD